ncbi:hypothetical protein SLL00_05875 [Metabacillus indicus]|uniref:hypothetical protein n=1 Tax=Metabacillus indicus TaxID=246786 RepID=UPI002A078D47|nr:hypothetical protein [Metabacillus indicus]MDX8289310.1 hypothetical protein [Metabacillus indicus]
MKKVVSLMFSAVLFLGVAFPAFAAESPEVQKAFELIDRTNIEIDKKIEKAVNDADKLQANYLLEARKIEESKEVVKLKDEKQSVQSEIAALNKDQKKEEKLEQKLVQIEDKIIYHENKINEKLLQIQNEMEALTVELLNAQDKDKEKIQKKLAQLNASLNKKSEGLETLNKHYTGKLQTIIETVYNETLEMSAKTIEKAAQAGVIAECSWKLVRFADQWVWIDPVRVVKF